MNPSRDGLLSLLIESDALTPWPHNCILRGHTTVEGSLKLRTKGELAQVGGLFLGESDSLLAEGLVLHALKAAGDFSDLVLCGIGRHDGGGDAVCAVAYRGAGL